MKATRLLPLEDVVTDTVAAYFDVDHEALLGSSRERHVVEARYTAAWVLREKGWSYPKIGKLFGRDHSTIMSGIARVLESPRLLTLATAMLQRVDKRDMDSDVLIEKRLADHVIASLEVLRETCGERAVKRAVTYYMEMIE